MRGGEPLPGQAGTGLLAGGERGDRRFPGSLARLGDASGRRRTKAHIHEQHESAFCMISGEEVDVYTGEQLEHRDRRPRLPVLRRGAPRGGQSQRAAGGVRRSADRSNEQESGDAAGAGREGAPSNRRPLRSARRTYFAEFAFYEVG